MFDSLRFTPLKLNIFSSIITLRLCILLLLFLNNFSLHFYHQHPNDYLHISPHQTAHQLKIITSEDRPASSITASTLHNRTPQDLDSYSNQNFDTRLQEFLTINQCTLQIFMTWIATVDSFGAREIFCLESLLKSNPTSCVIILSNTMDSLQGEKILNPFTKQGFRVQAMNPDLSSLFNNTPAEKWLFDIKNGNKNPGRIPLAQNLSNLIRLAVVYKHGGVYLDTDVVILKGISGLRNSIGAQSEDINGNWTRLNNAVMIFDKNHSLVYKFMEEFASSYNGDIWGHNGPYLVSRVVHKAVEAGEVRNFTVLPRTAFYTVDWLQVADFFVQPSGRVGEKWVESKIRQLRKSAYGVHLWNRQSGRFVIEEGSVIRRLMSDFCVTCNQKFSSL